MDETEEGLLSQLHSSLCRAFREAIAHAWRQHPGEQFYSYVLYTTPLLESATLTFNTEEALARVAHSTQKPEELRWIPSEWAYDEAMEQFFNPVDRILTLLLRLPEPYEEPSRDKRWQQFIATLKSLDGAGVFGTGEIRDGVFVNIMWGDLDLIAHVESARVLNPPASYLRYASYALPWLQRKENEIQHSRSMYKEESLARVRRVIAQVEADLRTTSG